MAALKVVQKAVLRVDKTADPLVGVKVDQKVQQKEVQTAV